MSELISIICQNLYKGSTKSDVQNYINDYPADIYAFQEIPRNTEMKHYLVETPEDIVTFCSGFIVNKEKGVIGNYSNGEAEKIWDEAFKDIYKSFRSAYWLEKEICLNNLKITIINVHCAPTYTVEFRYVLMNRLKQLKNRNVILLGDFNAAKNDQTEYPKEDGNLFLRTIEKSGFTELLSNTENEPQYTLAYNHKVKGWKKKKVDHIFVSNSLLECLETKGWSYSIEYIHDVNVNIDKLGYKKSIKKFNAFTDHSGIRLSIKDNS